MIKPFLISTFNPQKVLNKLTGRHITKERAKNTKHDQILSLHKALASFLTKRPIKILPHGSHYPESPVSLLPTELAKTLTVTLTHRM